MDDLPVFSWLLPARFFDQVSVAPSLLNFLASPPFSFLPPTGVVPTLVASDSTCRSLYHAMEDYVTLVSLVLFWWGRDFLPQPFLEL